MNWRRSVVTYMDDDEESTGGCAYERGHWEWDLHTEALLYVSDPPTESEEAVVVSYRAPIGSIEFKDNVDIIDQIRFRRRFQRKVKRDYPDVVTLQDLKDVALFTAPKNILSAKLINILHVPTTERLIRALILYSQYHLQIEDDMKRRTLELETKIRSFNSDKIEEVYGENLNDLRVLAAKEYTVMLTGGESKRYHHMGPQRKSRSLSERDARLFKILSRVIIHIIWIALGRKHYNQIELEVNRLFNSAGHSLKVAYLKNMTRQEINEQQLGPCSAQTSKLKSRSPLTNALYCKRFIDYRLLGLGVIKNPNLSPRLKHLLLAVAGPEEDYTKEGVTVGILGMQRQAFDIMLHSLSSIKHEHSNKSTGYLDNKGSVASLATKKSEKNMLLDKLYPDIEIPPKENDLIDQNVRFAYNLEMVKARPDNEMQRRRWQERLVKIRSSKADSKISYYGHAASPIAHQLNH